MIKPITEEYALLLKDYLKKNPSTPSKKAMVSLLKKLPYIHSIEELERENKICSSPNFFSVPLLALKQTSIQKLVAAANNTGPLLDRMEKLSTRVTKIEEFIDVLKKTLTNPSSFLFTHTLNLFHYLEKPMVLENMVTHLEGLPEKPRPESPLPGTFDADIVTDDKRVLSCLDLLRNNSPFATTNNENAVNANCILQALIVLHTAIKEKQIEKPPLTCTLL